MKLFIVIFSIICKITTGTTTQIAVYDDKFWRINNAFREIRNIERYIKFSKQYIKDLQVDIELEENRIMEFYDIINSS